MSPLCKRQLKGDVAAARLIHGSSPAPAESQSGIEAAMPGCIHSGELCGEAQLMDFAFDRTTLGASDIDRHRMIP